METRGAHTNFQAYELALTSQRCAKPHAETGPPPPPQGPHVAGNPTSLSPSERSETAAKQELPSRPTARPPALGTTPRPGAPRTTLRQGRRAAPSADRQLQTGGRHRASPCAARGRRCAGLCPPAAPPARRALPAAVSSRCRSHLGETKPWQAEPRGRGEQDPVCRSSTEVEIPEPRNAFKLRTFANGA